METRSRKKLKVQMTLDNPIIIFGSGRNGSTALQNRMAHHPEIAWISDRLANRRPHRPGYNRLLMHGLDVPILKGYLWNNYHPGECYMFWDFYSKSFRNPFRDLLAEDATQQDKQVFPFVFSSLVTSKRHRLLLKITGWPRLGWLQEVFPKAKFIHLVRDGRAVANSLLKVDFWTGWQGPTNWRRGELDPHDQQVWEKHGRSFVALAGLEWNIGCAAAASGISRLPAGSTIEVRYEDLCADGLREMAKLLDFVNLDFPKPYRDYLSSAPFVSQNEKWMAELTPAQQRILTDVTHPYLEKYRYLDDL
jgi:hypothetical protein